MVVEFPRHHYIGVMLNYDMPLYRPPSEGPNLIIQATLGCSFNECSFCSMYKTKAFTARPLADVFADVEASARMWPDAHRVFVADGDALVLPMESWRRLLDKLHGCLPELARVTCYATPASLLKKTPAELEELKARGMTLVYLGIESGSTGILKRVTKGATQASIIRALERASEAGLKVSATVILGLGGRTHWRDHVDGTADLVNRAPPTYLSTLQLHLDDAVTGEFMQRFGEPFQWQDDAGILEEQARLLERLNPASPVIFRSNHASNCLALAGTLPRDRDRLLAAVNAARSGTAPLRPQYLRGL